MQGHRYFGLHLSCSFSLCHGLCGIDREKARPKAEARATAWLKRAQLNLASESCIASNICLKITISSASTTVRLTDQTFPHSSRGHHCRSLLSYTTRLSPSTSSSAYPTYDIRNQTLESPYACGGGFDVIEIRHIHYVTRPKASTDYPLRVDVTLPSSHK